MEDIMISVNKADMQRVCQVPLRVLEAFDGTIERKRNGERLKIPIHSAVGVKIGHVLFDCHSGRMRTVVDDNGAVFNIHRALCTFGDCELIITEDVFDCMYMWQGAQRRVVSLMGEVCSAAQYRTIFSNMCPSRIRYVLSGHVLHGPGRLATLEALAKAAYLHIETAVRANV
jgi:hypothetical protein